MSSFTIAVDLANPGHYFACCGLLELAYRKWPGAEGWFDKAGFHIAHNAAPLSLQELVREIVAAPLDIADTEAEVKTAPLILRGPFQLRVDWWLSNTGMARLKTWAGQQNVHRIARAMQHAIDTETPDLLSYATVVRDADATAKTVEPFYFDARRFAHALDAGFSIDKQGLSTSAYPAVEFCTLLGLQRFRPSQDGNNKWRFIYGTWSTPLPPLVAAAASAGAVTTSGTYRFGLHFRDDQKRYKAFGFSQTIGGRP